MASSYKFRCPIQNIDLIYRKDFLFETIKQFKLDFGKNQKMS